MHGAAGVLPSAASTDAAGVLSPAATTDATGALSPAIDANAAGALSPAADAEASTPAQCWTGSWPLATPVSRSLNIE